MTDISHDTVIVRIHNGNDMIMCPMWPTDVSAYNVLCHMHTNYFTTDTSIQNYVVKRFEQDTRTDTAI